LENLPMPIAASSAAAAFVAGRRAAVGFPDYPGSLPSSLTEAYAVQAAAIAGWPDRIAGWKVGRILGDLAATLGADRFVGPIFAADVVRATPETPLPVISGGFGALEAEFVVRLGPAAAERRDWTPESAWGAVDTVHIGIEVAGSQLATINDLGPLASIAGFGNNVGLILGPEVADWRSGAFEGATCRTAIDGRTAQAVAAQAIPGGPIAGLAFALHQLHALGRVPAPGDYVSTGAITGVNPVLEGQVCSADFGSLGRIACRTVPAAASG
jgi:2-keto-4-pentenoate hydratase